MNDACDSDTEKVILNIKVPSINNLYSKPYFSWKFETIFESPNESPVLVRSSNNEVYETSTNETICLNTIDECTKFFVTSASSRYTKYELYVGDNLIREELHSPYFTYTYLNQTEYIGECSFLNQSTTPTTSQKIQYRQEERKQSNSSSSDVEGLFALVILVLLINFCILCCCCMKEQYERNQQLRPNSQDESHPDQEQEDRAFKVLTSIIHKV